MNSHYTDAYLILPVIQEDNIRLDFPYFVASQLITFNNVTSINLTSEMVGHSVLAFVRVKNEDEESVKGHKNYLGKYWDEVKGKITDYWTSEECIHPNLKHLSKTVGKVEAIEKTRVEEQAKIDLQNKEEENAGNIKAGE